MKPAAVILAGGRSSRFGSDKAQALVAGRTMLEHVVTAAAPLTDPILVVGGAGPCPPPARRIADREPGGGPVQAVVAALAHLSGRDWLLLACDLPYLTPVALAPLIAPLPAGPHARLVVLAGRRQYLASFWTADCAAAFTAAQAAGERALRRVAERVGVHTLDEAAVEPHCFADVDTPEAL